MKLSSIIFEILEPTLDYQKLVDKVKQDGGKFLGSGDYGSAYQIGDKVIKITTDEVEIEHAHNLKGKNTEHFVYIYDLNVVDPKLGIITMELLKPYKGEIPQDFIEAVKQEAEANAIDPGELDFVGDNIMMDPKSNKLKMIDV